MIIRAILLLAASATMAGAQDYSANSNAKGWGLSGEVKATFDAKVVDIACELSGDCPDNCGDGKRMLGLVRVDDNALIPVLKNSQTSFNGAIADLLPHCGKTIGVDGLFTNDEEFTGIAAKFYQVQQIRPEGAEEFARANNFTKDWKVKFPDSDGKGPWFRRDPRVLGAIEKDGYLGLGAEEDAKFIAEWF